MPHATFVEGERVSLHPLEEDDLAFVTEGVNHPQVRTPIGQSLPTSLARERRYLSELNERTDAIQLLVTVDGDRAGVVELDPIDHETGVADLGVWIHPDRHGGGYAREAIEFVIGPGRLLHVASSSRKRLQPRDSANVPRNASIAHQCAGLPTQM